MTRKASRIWRGFTALFFSLSALAFNMGELWRTSLEPVWGAVPVARFAFLALGAVSYAMYLVSSAAKKRREER